MYKYLKPIYWKENKHDQTMIRRKTFEKLSYIPNTFTLAKTKEFQSTKSEGKF